MTEMTDYGYIRAAACVPDVCPGRPMENARRIEAAARSAAAQGAQLICFPAYSLSGCTAADLCHSALLQQECLNALQWLQQQSADIRAIINVSYPVSAAGITRNATATILGGETVGTTISGESSRPLFLTPVCNFAIADTNALLQTDADIVLCPAAIPETAGITARLQSRLAFCSAELGAAVVMASAGRGESSTDYLYAGHSIIADNGEILPGGIADIDIELIRRKRAAHSRHCATGTQTIETAMPLFSGDGLMRPVRPNPFHSCPEVFQETFGIQTQALATRLQHIGVQKMVIGISGGLDSTLALLVCAAAADLMGLERTCITGITMPGFGTTDRTYTNALGMMKALGIEWREINIRQACLQHLQDIGHDISVHDSAYENAQARERTQILMDVANRTNGIAVGTGDLSELALGWCTYNGDHMSMYAVNASVPKTLIPGIISYAAELPAFSAAKPYLLDVIDTPITPELLPADNRGNIVQKTEDIIGPYQLHDFFIYHFVKNGYAPSKILYLAGIAFAGKYDTETIRKWLILFVKRFFNNQFKRSCMPDGPATGPVSLSPRCGWQMPSDASSQLWLNDLTPRTAPCDGC